MSKTSMRKHRPCVNPGEVCHTSVRHSVCVCVCVCGEMAGQRDHPKMSVVPLQCSAKGKSLCLLKHKRTPDTFVSL